MSTGGKFSRRYNTDVDTSQVDFGVSVLSSLRGGHVNNFAGAALDDNVTAESKEKVRNVMMSGAYATDFLRRALPKERMSH